MFTGVDNFDNFADISKHLHAIQLRICNIENDVESGKKNQVALAVELDRLNQWTRERNLIIQNIPERVNETREMLELDFRNILRMIDISEEYVQGLSIL